MFEEMIARYGWKTITGTMLLVLADAAPSIPALAAYEPLIRMFGTSLAGVGIVHKFDRLEARP